jgi:hypothetical protein
MATQEEILEQYGRDREDKIVQLQNVLSSRLAQDAKNSSDIIEPPNVTAINAFYTPSLPTQTPLLRSVIRRSNNLVKKELAEEFQRLATSDLQNTEGSADAYILVECQIFLRNYEQNSPESNTSLTVGGTISEQVFLRLPDSKNFSQFRPSRIPASFAFLDSFKLSSSNGSGFEQLKLKLSSLNYPIEILQLTSKFKGYYDAINEELKKRNLPPIASIPILVYSVFELGEFNFIFPKPDGLDTPPSVPGTPSVPTPPSVPGTPSVPTPPSVPGTPSAPDIPSTPTDAKKYLSIEAIKDDDPVIETQTTSSQVISLRFIDDDQDDQYYSRNELTPIKTETVSNKRGNLPDKSLGDKNPIVVSNEKKEIDKRTESQRLAEESDSLTKETPKEKSSTSVSGPNPNLKDGKAAKQEENSGSIPEDKKPKSLGKRDAKALTFEQWAKGPGRDPNGIYYRGTRPALTAPGSKPTLNFGVVETRFKNLFSFGSQLTKIFNGYTVESPVDVALLMNSSGLGRFNKNWPYMFGEGSEIHASIITQSNIIEKGSGGVGDFSSFEGEDKGKTDANWAANPHWCGLCTNFMLYSNKQYTSDEKSIDAKNTRLVASYYNKSPFNIFDTSLADNTQKYDKDIESKKTRISENNNTIDKKQKLLEKERKKAQGKESKYINNTSPTEYDQKKIDGFYVNVKRLESEISNLQNTNTKLETDIKNLQTDRETVAKNASVGFSYNESNLVALFQLGIHWNSNGLTSLGKQLWDKIKNWPGAFIVRRKESPTSLQSAGGHVETLLHITQNGELYTIGGNTGLADANGNGSHYGFKRYQGIYEFCGKGEYGYFYVHRRGDKNPYTNGIGISVKQTKMYKKFSSEIKTDMELDTSAYNILINIMEV